MNDEPVSVLRTDVNDGAFVLPATEAIRSFLLSGLQRSRECVSSAGGSRRSAFVVINKHRTI